MAATETPTPTTTRGPRLYFVRHRHRMLAPTGVEVVFDDLAWADEHANTLHEMPGRGWQIIRGHVDTIRCACGGLVADPAACPGPGSMFAPPTGHLSVEEAR